MHKQEPSQGHMEGQRVTHTYSCLLVRPHLQALPDCETEHVLEVVGGSSGKMLIRQTHPTLLGQPL